MKAAYSNLWTFEKKLYHYENTEVLHYKLLNIILLIVRNGWFRSFCNKYQGCELNYNRRRRFCLLCCIPDYFDNFEEELDHAQLDFFKLKMFDFKLFSLLLECYVYEKRSLEALSGHFYYSSRDRYTTEKNEMFLKD